jgi:phage tail sheath protein FI
VDEPAPLIRPSIPTVLLHHDPAWLFLEPRRVLVYLEHSLRTGLQWVVFEPHDEALWEQVRDSAAVFLCDQWQRGVLSGDRPEEAFFVRCDRTTMTQDDLDDGRLVLEVGVAPVRPAEFVLLRIGQWTAGPAPVSCPEPP